MIKQLYNFTCNQYARKFAKKHDLKFDGWVNNEIGETAYFTGFPIYDDMAATMTGIKIDINNNINVDCYENYIEYIIENEIKMNYKNWLKINNDYYKGFKK